MSKRDTSNEETIYPLKGPRRNTISEQTQNSKYSREDAELRRVTEFTYNDFPSSVTEFTNNIEPGEYVSTFSTRFDSIGNPEYAVIGNRCKIENLIREHIDPNTKSRTQYKNSTVETLQEQKRVDFANILTVFLMKCEEYGAEPGEREDTYEFRFDVAELSSGQTVYLEFPGKKSIEYTEDWGPYLLDFAVKIEGWENQKGSETPQHSEIFSDLYWKTRECVLETGNVGALESLQKSLTVIYNGGYPSEAIEHVDETAFNKGNKIMPILHALYWIMIQEDFNYPRGAGRDMCWTVITDILSLQEQDFTHTNKFYPYINSMSELKEYEQILLQDGVVGFEENDRGAFVNVVDVTQPLFALKSTPRQKWAPSTIVTTHGD